MGVRTCGDPSFGWGGGGDDESCRAPFQHRPHTAKGCGYFPPPPHECVSGCSKSIASHPGFALITAHPMGVPLPHACFGRSALTLPWKSKLLALI